MKYIEINIDGYNKMYTVSNANVEKEITKFVKEGGSSVHYLPVLTSKGETLKLQWDNNRTIKVLPDYLESEVSGEIVKVGESFVSQVHHGCLGLSFTVDEETFFIKESHFREVVTYSIPSLDIGRTRSIEELASLLSLELKLGSHWKLVKEM